MLEPKAFWDGKIVGWELDRYGPGGAGARTRLGRPLRFRMRLAERILSPLVPGQRVLEVGCGSGRLIELLLRSGPALVKGVDLSAKAIDEAGHRLRSGVRSGRVTLEVGDVGSATLSGFDWVIGLGLLDWLGDSEILELFRRISPAAFLFSISERRRNLAQLVHRGYVWLKYGHRTHGYVPAYQTVAHITNLAREAGYGELYALRDRRLSFGALVATWPIQLPPDIEES
jgi:2-polyprenyl-3-methyl-5-hydroxy-6-metoxy-1,4-benzoquinol methylase